MTSEFINPPLKYVGGKRFLRSRIKDIWDATRCRRLVEPFSGGMSISLGIQPKKALINDINPHVINFFKSVQEGLLIDIEMLNDQSFYYDRRVEFNELISNNNFKTWHSASLYYYLIKSCFNGVSRFNSKGLFNTPFGKYKTINFQREFNEVSQAIANWKFLSVDFSKIKFNKTDLAYLDPPYDVEFTGYAAQGFNWDEQERLIKHISHFDNPMVISNQATSRIIELYELYGFNVTYINAPRRVSCNGDRTKAREVLAFKNFDV